MGEQSEELLELTSRILLEDDDDGRAISSKPPSTSPQAKSIAEAAKMRVDFAKFIIIK
jgi:hypothetical protein